jgi:hypothetical protein
MPGKKFNRSYGSSLAGTPPGSKKQRNVKLAGENTSEIKKDKKGKPFALVLESTQSGLMKGDTIRPGKAARVGNYISGGDYNVKKISKKNFKIK